MSTSDGAAAQSMHIVLVAGFWLGGWAWDEVVVDLRRRGLEATALTLPGLEPDHPDRGSIRVEDHVTAIVQALDESPSGARTVLGDAFDLLQLITDVRGPAPLLEASADGTFGELKRPATAGKGLDGRPGPTSRRGRPRRLGRHRAGGRRIRDGPGHLGR